MSAMARVLHQLDQKPLAAQAFDQAMALAKAQASDHGPATLPAEVAHRMGQYLLELGDHAAAVQVLTQASATTDEPTQPHRPLEPGPPLGQELTKPC